jgi:cytochrome c oxidase cbb3-type subunit 3
MSSRPRSVILRVISAATLVIAIMLLVSPNAKLLFAKARTASTLSPPRPDNEGRPIFEAVCAGCHGLDGRGGERGPDIATRQQVVQLSDAEIMDVLRGGRPTAGMPPFNSLGTDKLNALLEYLRVLQGKRATVALPGDPHAGKTLFFGKARCSECHMVHGDGGFLGRDLSTYGATLSPTEIRAKIVRSGDDRSKANKIADITLRDGQKLTGVIRNEDNFSVQLQSSDGAFHFLTKSDIEQLQFQTGSIMPSNYGSTLTASELDDLVSYLISAAKLETKKEHSEEDQED